MKPLNRQTVTTTAYPEQVIQFGAGNFLRGFADWMIDILNEEAGFSSSVIIIKPTPRGSYEALNAQDNLYHTRLHEIIDGELKTSTRLITCVSRTINPYAEFTIFMALAQQPELRFVISNTTESGIAFNPEDNFDSGVPRSFPAKLTRFLFERYQHFDGACDKGMVILPCELIENNAEQLKSIVLQYAELWQLDAGFSNWLDKHNLFCNTLVDRIVTGLPKAGLEGICQDLDYQDNLLVEGEAYHSWIIEAPDTLQAELPTYQTNLNVQFVRDLSVAREIKVRILNGAHTAMVPVAYLLGERTVDGAMNNVLLESFIRDLLFKEVIPSFTNVSKDELELFANATLNRFKNPTLKHQLSAIALNSTSKFRTRLLPSLNSYYEQKRVLPKRIVLALACLIRFYKGDWQGKPTPVQDDATVIARWQTLWQNSHSAAKFTEDILATTEFWGQDLKKFNGLATVLAEYLERLEQDGIESLLASLSSA